jgi:hypothetical protein
MRKCIVVLVIALSLMACKKEESLTSAELMAVELKSVMKKSSISRIATLRKDQFAGNLTYYGDFGRNYKFQGEFVYIEGIGYNLNNLIQYQVHEIPDGDNSGTKKKFMLLTFY